MTTAYGVVAQCNLAMSLDTIEPAVSRLARTRFPNASIALVEDTDHGWLVGPQLFVFLYVTESGRSFWFGAGSSNEKP